MTQRFHATLLLHGKTATGVPVPPEVLDRLGGGKRPKVLVTIGSHTYRSSVGSTGGRAMLPVSTEQRARTGVAAGDMIDVELELDTAPREVVVPDDFASALATEPAARRFFDGLSYSQQRWFVLDVEGARRVETRQRRIERSLAMLLDGRAR